MVNFSFPVSSESKYSALSVFGHFERQKWWWCFDILLLLFTYFFSEKILCMFLLQCLIKLKFHPRYQYDFGLFFWLSLFGIWSFVVMHVTGSCCLPPLVSTFVRLFDYFLNFYALVIRFYCVETFFSDNSRTTFLRLTTYS